MPKKVTRKTLPLVWLELTRYVADCLDNDEATKSDLDDFLDKLAEQDAFGTEGQNDPRGDQRG